LIFFALLGLSSCFCLLNFQVRKVYLVNQAIKEYLQTHAWQIEKITQGIAAAERGELIEHDQMMQEIEELIEEKEKNKA
jgi:predicted transcriptional regulator